MALQKPDLGDYDPEGAGDADDGVFGLPLPAEACSLRLVPVPWEATTSYGRGTAQGPSAIMRASPQLDLFDPALAEHGLGCPYAFGIHFDPEDPELVGWNARACEAALPVIEAGGVSKDPALADARDVVDTLSARIDDWVRERVSALLRAGHVVGLVGGDHSVPLGAMAAHGEHGAFGVLHVDAHADLRVAYEGFAGSHASIMHNVLESVPAVKKLVQVGIRDQAQSEWQRARDDERVVQYTEAAVRDRLFGGEGWRSVCDELVGQLPERVYVSFDIDGLDPALCPSTGTPVPGGLSFAEANVLLMALVRGGKRVIGFDLCEVAPAAPSNPELDEWDANVGARILYRLCGLALHGAGARD